ncbi:MAG: 50S ribosomal protein L30 [Acidobacteria bacterium]|jgi:ribosomal protein L30|nr:50S ribosomal protein L30 [Acidobacteriota bacterium]
MVTKKKKEAHVVVTLVKRPSTEKLRKIAWSMGLRKMNDTKRYPDRPEIRGMIFAVKHLLSVTEES